MTYREKLKMEHPEKVNPGAIGGCLGCPYDYGYEASKQCEQLRGCNSCWNRVIPGTEEKLTFKIPTNLDEMVKYFEAHGFNVHRSYSAPTDIYQFTITKGNRCTIDISFKYPQGKSEAERGAVMLDYCERLIVKFDNDVLETKQSCIDDLCKAVDKRDKEIEMLKEQITKLEKKNETYSRTCAIYKSKDSIIEKLEREREHLCSECQARDKIIEELDKRVENLNRECEDKSNRIKSLEGACSAKNEEIVRQIKTINTLNDKIDGLNIGRNQLREALYDQRRYSAELLNKITMKNDQLLELDKKVEELQQRNDRQGGTIINLKKRLNSLFVVSSDMVKKSTIQPEMKVYATRREAEQLICDMEAIIDLYGCCTIGDLKYILQVRSSEDDESKGWYSVKDAKVVKMSEGYIVILPREVIICD